VQEVCLNPEIADTVRCKWTASGEYSTASAYRAQFFNSIVAAADLETMNAAEMQVLCKAYHQE
jgi:hypothetical protein